MDSKPQIIDAQEIRLRNPAGEMVGVLTGESSGVSLTLNAPGKPVRVAVGLDNSGDAGLVVNDANGNPQVSVFSHQGLPSISFREPSGKITAAVTVAEGLPILTVGEFSVPLHEVLEMVVSLCKSRRPTTSQN